MLKGQPSATESSRSLMMPRSINSAWKRRVVDVEKLGWRKTWTEAEEALVGGRAAAKGGADGATGGR